MEVVDNDFDEGDEAPISLELRFSNYRSSIPFEFDMTSQVDNFWKEFKATFERVQMKVTDMNLIKILLGDRIFMRYNQDEEERTNTIMSL